MEEGSYYIATEMNHEALAMEVNRLIAEGWRPQGGVSAYYHTDGKFTDYSQAMVKDLD